MVSGFKKGSERERGGGERNETKKVKEKAKLAQM